jgi:small subunit ribosomal protein S14
MARKAMVLKALKKPKYMTRKVRRCRICGRSRGYMGKFQMCRICFRNLASRGMIPGVTKSSW